MNLQKIRLFLHLAESLNFSQTADDLYMTQPAITKAIRSLENEINVVLFERGKRFVRLTEAGYSFYEDCKVIVAQMDMAISRARNVAQQAESMLSIGYTGTYFESIIIPKLISFYNQKYEKVSLYLMNSSHTVLKQQLLDSHCDIIFITLDDLHDINKISFEKLIEGDFVCVMPKDHPLANKEILSLKDLDHEKIIIFNALQSPPMQNHIQNQLKQNCRHSNFYYTDSIILSHTMIQGGLGISVMPSFVTSPEHQDVAVVPMDIDCHLTYGIAIQQGVSDEIVSDFIQIAKEMIDEYSSPAGNDSRPYQCT